MTIEITSVQLKIITDWAETIYPEECCGILLGKMEFDRKIVVEVIPTVNDWQPHHLASQSKPDEEIHRTKNSRYHIPPQEIFRAQKRGRDLELGIIGFFHSHPNCPAIPSEADRNQAWEVYSYPIVSVIQGNAIDIKSWVLDHDCVFQPEAIQLI
jgi:proteasome lid subunit RPN8/RPN11